MKFADFPMTTQIDSYMILRSSPYVKKFDLPQVQESQIERRITKIEKTYRFLRKKFGRRKIVEAYH